MSACSTSTPAPPPLSTRRLSQVYVQIPPSPFASSSKTTSRDASEDLRDHKQMSTPLRVRNDDTAFDSVTAAQIKRKRSERDLDGREESQLDFDAKTSSKKQKMIVEIQPRKSNSKKTTKAKPLGANANEEYPNGFFYCHQCAKKRGLEVGIPCTFKVKVNHVDSQCKAKYCKACMKNRYGQDIDEIKGRSLNAKESASHVKGQGYYFKCPRCEGTCNCRACRKAQGLGPTGNLTLAARKSGADSVAEILNQDDKVTGILPGKGKQVPDAPKKPRAPAVKASKPAKPAASTAVDPQPKVKRPYVRKPKPVPQPTWNPVPVPTSFDADLATPRIAIREFLIRFWPLLDISRTHLEELEEVGGRRAFDEDDVDLDAGEDIGVEMGWVSETCVKAMLSALLGLIAEDDGAKEVKKLLVDAVKEIKASGANLSRMWGTLLALRASLTREQRASLLDFPDPLPPPASAITHTTRSGASHGGPQVASTAQLVPVILPLVEAASRTQSVRQEIDEGVKEEKDRVKEEKDRLKEEQERWASVRKGTPTKAEREAHKQTLAGLEQGLRVVRHVYAPRFAPLGTDHAGRIYYALSPSIVEREAALALLGGDAKKGGKARGRAVVSSDEREGMRRWGWFVAVWGSKPEPEPANEANAKGKSKELDEDEDDGSERWWGFWEPREVRNIADWIAGKNGVSVGKGRMEEHQDMQPEADSGTLAKLEARSRSGSTAASSHYSSPLSDASDDEMDVDDVSELSALSDEEDDNGMKGMMRTAADGKPLPGRSQLKALVKGLHEYADVLDWRVWRMQSDEAKDGKENEVKDKGKQKEKSQAVASARFYG
ncbi:hypothetical protein FA95DRAFT_1597841 [Auriscalpium vulgare]|uniref:Uncharacterized protein n=1 Tax=Auriscalpium vulgare TaxID=40419 RepID=A0ACB8RJ46_9AGAM|nr:hypothetical protein FA95DRAFT_1597841 [Auriscalpium vulgare]